MKRIFTIPLLLLISNFATGQSLQGGLENWRNYTSTNSPQLEAPISWFGIDSLVYYVTDQFPGGGHA